MLIKEVSDAMFMWLLEGFVAEVNGCCTRIFGDMSVGKTQIEKSFFLMAGLLNLLLPREVPLILFSPAFICAVCVRISSFVIDLSRQHSANNSTNQRPKGFAFHDSLFVSTNIDSQPMSFSE